MRKVKFLLIVALVVLLSNGALAQVKGVPVDIPGTGVNFFLYRYEGVEAPYNEINQIWANLSSIFSRWVEEGQKPGTLTGEDVLVKVNGSGSVTIYIKDQFIVEVDEYHAKINKATPAQLGEKWAANLKLGVEKFVAINQPK